MLAKLHFDYTFYSGFTSCKTVSDYCRMDHKWQMVPKNNTAKIIGNRTSASVDSLFNSLPTEAEAEALSFFSANKHVEFARSWIL